MSLFRIFGLIALFIAFPAVCARAAQINWGTSVSLTDVNFTSTGAPLDNSFTFALGTFGATFNPDDTNVDLWASNWKVLDTAVYNPTFDYFSSTTDLANNNVFPAGEKAYIWIYNSPTAVAGSEWVLVRGVDKNAGAWAIPAAPGDQTSFPLNFRISQVTNTIFGGSNGIQGPGQFSTTPANFTLQTHTFATIPEPGTAGLLAGGLLGLLRRRRTAANQGIPLGNGAADGPVLPVIRQPPANFKFRVVPRLAILSVGGAFLGSPIGKGQAHNLDQLDTSIAFDKATLDLMASRAGLSQSLIQAGDSIGLVLKSTPGPGTATGAGGYMTFYIPPGTQVEKAEYGRPTPSGSFTAIPMKGPAIMALGDGSVGTATTAGLIGLTLGPNVAGVTSGAVSAAGAHNGTLAGVYGDTGIFYATDPKLVWQSFVNTGGYDRNTGTSDNILTNNRGEARVPINKWDAEQLIGLGLASPAAAILDPDGRGNTPWGTGSAVAGPQSGYQWAFDRDYYLNNPSNPARMRNAIVTGPWNRIKYPGSTLAMDQPGLKTTALGFATADASTLGATLTPASPLPQTLNWTDSISPKAVRFSYGGLVLGQSEYARVQLKILAGPGQPNSPFDANGCFFMNTDTFGGDAGGEQGGKDHLWRYYDPTTQTINPCAMLQKQFAKTPLAPGETSYFELVVINTGTAPMTNVVITDPMPAGLNYVSAVPAPTSTAPLTFTLGTVPSQGYVKIRVNVTATGTGTLFNTATMTSSAGMTTAMDSVEIGVRSILDPAKTVTPSNVSPGATVTYTVTINNIGTGTNGTPLVLTDVLPAGFTYGSFGGASLNGAAAAPGVVTVNATNPARPVFTVSQGIQAGKSLVITLNAVVSASQAVGTYGNAVSMNYEGKVVTSGSLAPVTVGGARVGDTIFRDWNGNGTQEAGEEGIAGVAVGLYNSSGSTLLATTTTDSSGTYAFPGLTAGTYQVQVTPPPDYLQTADPDALKDNKTNVAVTANQVLLTADFGYQYDATSINAASIGDFVFSDTNNSRSQDPSEAGIPLVTVNLYEDSNGNGAIDSGDLLIASLPSADGATNDYDNDTEIDPEGFYLFAGLDPANKYIVDVNGADPDIGTFFGVPFQQSTPDRVAVGTQLPGDSFASADFGFFGVSPASLGDQVFLDNDGSGTFSTGDAPLANITVQLYLDANGDGIADPGELVSSQSTTAAGIYNFTNLGPSDYLVKVLASDPDLPAGTTGTVAQQLRTLASGDAITTADFPYVKNLTKTADKTSALAADSIVYTMRPYYPGPAVLTNAVVTDATPAGTTYNGSASPVPSVQPSVGATGNVTWNLGTTTAATAGTGGTPEFSPDSQSVLSAALVADTYIDAAATGTNRGTDATLRTRPAAAAAKASLLKFTLPALASSDIIDKAYIRLRVSGARTSNHTINLYRITNPTAWGETTATWSDLNGATAGDWLTAGGNFGASDYDGANSWGTYSAPYTIGQEFVFDVTTLVRGWRDGSIANDGVALVASGTDNGDVTFFSSDGGTAGTTPGPRLDLGVSSSGSVTNATVLDSFGTVAYNNNDGTRSWLGNWFEVADDGKPSTGVITIKSGVMAIKNTVGKSVQRAVDLSGATAAELSVNLKANALSKAGDVIALEASRDAGKSWSRLETYTLGTATGIRTFDLITALGSVGPDTRIRFNVVSNGGRAKTISLDDVRITYSTPMGGATATALAADTALFTGTRNVTVTMTTTSAVLTTVTPPADLTPTVLGGATASKISGPVPASASVGSTPVAFTWVYQVAAGSGIGSVRFAGQPTAPPGYTFGTANSQSVLVTPPLTFTAKVNTPVPASLVLNTATLTDNNGLNVSATASTATSASMGDLVWQDTNGDGLQDADGADNALGTSDDEPGISGIRVFSDTNGNGVYDGGEPSTLTNSAGIYRIFGFAPGTYTARLDAATLPTGYTPTTPTSNTAILTAFQQYSNADFGLRPSPQVAGVPGSGIGDTLWLDANKNGSVDGTETLLAGITVNLYFDTDNSGTINGGDLLAATTATDANGAYLFAGLNAGNYLVDVDETDPQMPAGVAIVSGGANGAGLQDVTLGSGLNHLTADFGYNYSGSIGDYVWYDLNGDGIQNNSTGEIPVPNAVVTLYGDTNNNGALEAGEPILRFTTTNASGLYLFDNLPAGSYLVKVEEQEVPAPPTSPFAGQPARMQSSTGTTKAVALAAAQTYGLADFGFLEVATVEGHVFYDANGNGVLDPGETILPNVTVTLTGTDGNGAPVSRTTTTDAGGAYKFLPPSGTYTVAYNTADPDIPAALGTRTTPVSFLFGIASGNEVQNLDFGVDNTGSIGDTIFANPNSNATQDAGESGLANVAVNLYTDAARTVLLDSKVTDASGRYLFTGLPDATYYTQVVTSTLPGGYLTTPTADPDAAKDSLGTASVTGGGSVLSQDFGYTATVPTFAVSGTIFRDLNTNGAPNVPGEQLTGVTVTAVVTTGSVTQTFLSTTDSNGLYTFTGIPTGSNLTITVSPATLGSPAYVQTVDPDAAINNTTSITNLTANLTGRNFGYVLSLGSIAGSVVRGDGDGLAESGEPAQSNVPVQLVYAGTDGIQGTGDDQTFNTTTSGTGAYSFTGLLPGNYAITTTVPAAIHPLADRDGINPNSISLTLSVGQNAAAQDFEYQSSSISGTVMADTDNNSTGDTPMNGVTLTLTGSNGIPVDNPNLAGLQDYVTTTVNGTYAFTGLPAGSYLVRQTQPADYLSFSDSDSTVDAAGSPADPANSSTTDNQIPVLLALGETDSGNDFVERPAGTISGFVLADTNNNNVGDAPLANVALTLKNTAGADIDRDPDTPGMQPTTTTTALDGSYSFPLLPAGLYRVVETQPAGYVSVSDVDGDNLDEIGDFERIVVVGGAVTADQTFVEELAAGISGFVLADTNNDDVGDAGIIGVTLTLFTDPDGDGNPADGAVYGNPETTAADGSYSFTNLPAGGYLVVQSQPPGYLDVTDRDTTTDTAGSPADAANNLMDNFLAVNLMAGETDTGNTFVEEQPGSITGLVLADIDNNNTGDDPVDNVTLTLKNSAGADVDSDPFTGGVQPTVTTTGTNGSYSFTDLRPGSYRIVETQPAGYLSVSDADGGNPDIIGDVTLIVLGAGGSAANRNFIEEEPGSISGSVRIDTDNNGTGDAPLGGVTLTLKDSTGADIDGDPNTGGTQPVTTTSAPNGSFGFTGVAPGSYRIAETQPAGYLSVSDVDGGNLDLIGDVTLITVTAAQTATGQDFVEKALKQDTFNAWKTWNGLTGSDALPVPDAGGTGGNPDQDLYSNLLEYAFCFPPRSGVNLRCANEVRIAAGGRIDYAVTQVMGLTDVTISLQVAGSLGSPTVWTAAGSLVSTSTANPDGTSTIVYQDLESLGAAYADGDGFIRVRVGLDTNGDTIPDVFDYAPVSGWTDHTHAGNISAAIRDQCTTFSMPYLKCPVISGVAGGNTSGSIDLTASAGGVSVAGGLNPLKRYFVEATGGALEGHRFEVDVATSSASLLGLKTVSRVNTRSLTAGALTGAPVLVRELWTYRELFPPATFLAGTNSIDSDTLLVHTGTAWKTYFLANLGFEKRWVLDGDVALLDQGNEILTPCEGLFVHRRGVSLTIARNGFVRDSDFAKPLPAPGCVLVGSGYPLDQSYASRAMTVAAGFRGDVDLALASQVLFWAGDTLPGRMCYTTDFLLDAGSNPLRYWADADDSFLTNRNALRLLDGTSAAFHCLPVALPNYVVPAQWYSAP